MRDIEEFQRGATLRRQIVGEVDADQKTGTVGVWTKTFVQEEIEHLWGTYWARPELDLRSRSICTISLLIALGYMEVLGRYLRGALRNKLLTKGEIRELIMHTASYVGYPSAVAARRVAQDVFEKEDG